MSMTPEGAVKHKLKRILALKGDHLDALWPVQNGMGCPALDVHICYKGRYLGIEVKAANKNMTPRQVVTATKLHKAGAKVLLINEASGWTELAEWFDSVDKATDYPHVVQADALIGLFPESQDSIAKENFVASFSRNKLPNAVEGDSVRIDVKDTGRSFGGLVTHVRSAAVGVRITRVL